MKQLITGGKFVAVQEAVIHPDLYGVRRSNRPRSVPSSSLLYEVVRAFCCLGFVLFIYL